MYCKYCSEEIDDDARYCSHCGKPQVEENKLVSMDDWEKFVKLNWFKMIYAIYALLGIVYILLQASDHKYEYGDYFESLIFKRDLAYFILFVVIVPICISIVIPFAVKWWKDQNKKQNQKEQS